MRYMNVSLPGFCVDAGLPAGCRLDVVFLKHPAIGMFLELFT
jgi:hypothetical protein